MLLNNGADNFAWKISALVNGATVLGRIYNVTMNLLLNYHLSHLRPNVKPRARM
jgi:hypothetical protein